MKIIQIKFVVIQSIADVNLNYKKWAFKKVIRNLWYTLFLSRVYIEQVYERKKIGSWTLCFNKGEKQLFKQN